MSRGKEGPASLNELMGKQGGELTLDNLPGILGEKMPEIPLDRVGRFRLSRALKNRFGDGFRNIPGVKSLLKDFDKKMKFDVLTKANRRK